MSENRPLVYNKLYTINKSKDGITSFNIGVYEGTASINIFTVTEESRRPVVKINMPQDAITKLIYIAEKCLTASPESKFTISTNRYNPETKKSEPTGSITMGRDSSRTPYIAISSDNLSPNSPQIYYIRSSLSWEMSQPEADENNIIALKTFIKALDMDVRIAKLNTSHKKTQSPGGQQGGAGMGVSQQKSVDRDPILY